MTLALSTVPSGTVMSMKRKPVVGAAAWAGAAQVTSASTTTVRREGSFLTADLTGVGLASKKLPRGNHAVS
ncbi:hypothetical protein Cco03nite_56830 [Catellatospora coxensis]|uniref:Uncharacterized protein n=1 Tax=Catellatospora coxensis TaxID=310354 RepID=A0A8J3KZC5_9ACTN|nr:hypothetical protein Cco03nite_56830 [Catellatospora coxensis]